MARYTQPKTKLMRKVGTDLSLKSNPLKVARRINVLPGFHGRRGRRKVSDYGQQLLEKQKVKFLYGILEKQFRNYFEAAASTKEITGTALLVSLETRLDNVIYRLGMAPTRAAARQLVSHGNAKVNDKKISIPSYHVEVGDVISLTERATKIPYIAELLKQKDKGISPWLERKQNFGKIARMPEREDIVEDINEQLIVEYYSK
jgi:small subunit ribosomal protein S4